MDLIDQLSVKKPLTTGLAKRLESFEQEDSFTVAGRGFLFDNNSVFKQVRERLYRTEESDDEVNGDISHDVQKDHISLTQKVLPAYDGEDLEQDFSQQHKPRGSVLNSGSRSALDHRSFKQNAVELDHRGSDFTQIVEDQPDPTTAESSNQELETQILPADLGADFGSNDLESTERDLEQNIPGTIIDEVSLRATVKDIDTSSTKCDPVMQIETEQQDRTFDYVDRSLSHKSANEEQIPPSAKRFSARAFVDAFDDVSDSDEENTNFDSDSKTKTSRSVDVSIEKANTSNTSKETTETYSSKAPELSSLKLYQGSLRHKLQDENVIALSSSSDDDDQTESNLMISKAAILDLKARLSKKRGKFKTAGNKGTSASTSLRNLFNTLRKANKEQIMEYKKGKIGLNGVDLATVASEKESVEALLERELARNKRIKLREMQRQKEDGTVNDSDGDFSSDLNFSNDEFDSDISDQDENDLHSQEISVDNDATGAEDLAADQSALRSEINSDNGFNSSLREHLPAFNGTGKPAFPETNNEELSEREVDTQADEEGIEGQQDQEREDEEGEDLQLRKVRRRQLRLAESDDETPQNQQKEKIIDLGAYGNNIPNTITDMRSEAKENLTHEKHTILPNAIDTSNHSGTDISRAKDVEDAEALRAMIQRIMEKRQKREARREMHIRELRRSKANQMMDIEAEESEDEWFGVGGADGEGSDEVDSELEAMIDDFSNSNSNYDEIRKRLIEDDISKDKDMVNRILHDIKTGGLRKRGRGALDLELSDGEDEELLKYHARRKEIMRQKLTSATPNGEITITSKSKAFFESAAEEFGGNINFLDEEIPEETRAPRMEIPSYRSVSRVSTEKKVLSEEFVQQTLSFLTSRDEEDTSSEKAVASSSRSKNDDFSQELENLHTLKQRSSIKLFSNTPRRSNFAGDDDLEDALTGNKSNSIFNKFKHHKEASDMFKEGQKTVKSKTLYKVAGSSKASITYLGKSRKLKTKKKTAKLNTGMSRRRDPADSMLRASSTNNFET
ncbi:LAME_0G00254g1_1 [Lachancea meyersii CBS 8951]|uniref:LAME_0G00254g1_1 n=1 Tax=Lachancea meyersii CBS 8951 TaxID=1266667 RepID=A0A1G4K4M5_9SACH|nr:LAME_0G00254g1_1 [Lachancea meyersii CBS 8951]